MRSVVNWSIHFFESLLLQRIEIELVFSVLRPRSAPPPELLLLRIMRFMGVQCRKELGSIPIAPLWISLFLGNGNNERYRRRCVCVMEKKDLLTLLREEDICMKKTDLIEKLVKIVDYLWETENEYKEVVSKSQLEEMKEALKNSTFRFSAMYRSFIPKPNKPGQFRPITQPKKVDIIVMDSLSHLLNLVFEDIFLACSHGFRKGLGAITFFLQIHSWGPVDRVIKSDIVGCFDNIDHGLLISVLQSHLGKENPLLCDLLLDFLQTPILDKKGNNSSNHTKGIPQGCSLSPVLMNLFMHEFDTRMLSFIKKQERIGYFRYADDMIIAIKRGINSDKVYLRFKQFFHRSLNDLKLSQTSEELIREKR